MSVCLDEEREARLDFGRGGEAIFAAARLEAQDQGHSLLCRGSRTSIYYNHTSRRRNPRRLALSRIGTEIAGLIRSGPRVGFELIQPTTGMTVREGYSHIKLPIQVC